MAVLRRKGLAEAGYVENRNVLIDYRWAEDRYDRLPGLAAEFVSRDVNVILASGPPAALAAKAATKTIPVIFVVGFDPVAAGLVESLNRPGGNLTGMYLYIAELLQKKLQFLREVAPKVDHVDLIVNPGTPSAKLDAEEMEAARRNGGPAGVVLDAGNDAEIDTVFAELGARGAAAIVGTDTFYFAHRQHLSEVAARTRVPAIYFARDFVTIGGLMSYGANIPEIYRQSGVFTARILKGEKPADIPVQQPTKFELVINLKTANALGLTVPATLLATADEVIE